MKTFFFKLSSLSLFFAVFVLFLKFIVYYTWVEDLTGGVSP